MRSHKFWNNFGLLSSKLTYCEFRKRYYNSTHKQIDPDEFVQHMHTGKLKQYSPSIEMKASFWKKFFNSIPLVAETSPNLSQSRKTRRHIRRILHIPSGDHFPYSKKHKSNSKLDNNSLDPQLMFPQLCGSNPSNADRKHSSSPLTKHEVDNYGLTIYRTTDDHGLISMPSARSSMGNVVVVESLLHETQGTHVSNGLAGHSAKIPSAQTQKSYFDSEKVASITEKSGLLSVQMMAASTPKPEVGVDSDTDLNRVAKKGVPLTVQDERVTPANDETLHTVQLTHTITLRCIPHDATQTNHRCTPAFRNVLPCYRSCCCCSGNKCSRQPLNSICKCAESSPAQSDAHFRTQRTQFMEAGNKLHYSERNQPDVMEIKSPAEYNVVDRISNRGEFIEQTCLINDGSLLIIPDILKENRATDQLLRESTNHDKELSQHSDDKPPQSCLCKSSSPKNKSQNENVRYAESDMPNRGPQQASYFSSDSKLDNTVTRVSSEDQVGCCTRNPPPRKISDNSEADNSDGVRHSLEEPPGCCGTTCARPASSSACDNRSSRIRSPSNNDRSKEAQSITCECMRDANKKQTVQSRMVTTVEPHLLADSSALPSRVDSVSTICTAYSQPMNEIRQKSTGNYLNTDSCRSKGTSVKTVTTSHHSGDLRSRVEPNSIGSQKPHKSCMTASTSVPENCRCSTYLERNELRSDLYPTISQNKVESTTKPRESSQTMHTHTHVSNRKEEINNEDDEERPCYFCFRRRRRSEIKAIAIEPDFSPYDHTTLLSEQEQLVESKSHAQLTSSPEPSEPIYLVPAKSPCIDAKTQTGDELLAALPRYCEPPCMCAEKRKISSFSVSVCEPINEQVEPIENVAQTSHVNISTYDPGHASIVPSIRVSVTSWKSDIIKPIQAVRFDAVLDPVATYHAAEERLNISSTALQENFKQDKSAIANDSEGAQGALSTRNSVSTDLNALLDDVPAIDKYSSQTVNRDSSRMFPERQSKTTSQFECRLGSSEYPCGSMSRQINPLETPYRTYETSQRSQVNELSVVQNPSQTSKEQLLPYVSSCIPDSFNERECCSCHQLQPTHTPYGIIPATCITQSTTCNPHLLPTCCCPTHALCCPCCAARRICFCCSNVCGHLHLAQQQTASWDPVEQYPLAVDY